jgi:hypothetical protein
MPAARAQGDGATGEAVLAPSGASGDRWEQGGLELRPQAARLEPFVQIGFKIVIAGHLVLFAALFVEAHPWRRWWVNASSTRMLVAAPTWAKE